MRCTFIGLAIVTMSLMAPIAEAQRGPGGGQQQAARMPSQRLRLLMVPPVQRELELTEEQVQKVRNFGSQLRQELSQKLQGLRELSRQEQQAKFRELQRSMQQKTKKHLGQVLESEQQQRFEQIRLQQIGPLALLEPNVQNKLQLSDEQTAEIQSLIQSYQKQIRALIQNAQNNRQEVFRKLQSLQEQTMSDALEVLTEEQRSTWKKLTGEPFTMRPGPGGNQEGGGPGQQSPQ